MKRIVLAFALGCVAISSSAIDTYDELISTTMRACGEPSLLLAPAFTNDVMNYRTACTDAQGQCAADLAMAISLMHRMEHDEACVGDDTCFRRHQGLVSNIVHCAELDAGSWIRYAAAAEYAAGLNYGNQQEASFVLSTNMVARIAMSPPDMGTTNYWNSMSGWMGCPDETLPTVFRLNAAIWLAGHNSMGEIAPLTNSLPPSAISIFEEELE